MEDSVQCTAYIHQFSNYQSSHLNKAVWLAVGNLNLGGPSPIGAQKANLSPDVQMFMEEIALSEQVSHCSDPPP